jgi:hypothetical protein
MRQLLLIFVCAIASAAFCGCSQKSPTARKEIQVPDGGPPVLTSAERAARDVPKSRDPRIIAQASYEQPTDSRPQIVKPFEQWTDQEAAEDALGRIGAPAVPALIDALRSVDPNVRKKAIEVLGRMGEDAAPAVLSLTALLDDPDITVRKAAARTLGQIGPAAKDAVPSLMRNLFQQPALEPAPASPALQAVPAQPQPE